MTDAMLDQARRVVENRWRYLPSLLPWAEALLAEHEARVEAERDQYRKDFYERDLPAMQRLAVWLDPDPDLPLPNLDVLVAAAIARTEQAERERDGWEATVAALNDALNAEADNYDRVQQERDAAEARVTAR